jgi:hemoglobin
MTRKKDIKKREDIIRLVDGFYAKVRADEMLGPIFDQVAHTNWERHLPVMYDFWENVIFHTGTYTGNPMTAHQRVHALQPFTKAHFNRWLELFRATLHEQFEGLNTDITDQRATSIATVMQLKLEAW